MTFTSLQLALQTTILAVVFATAGHAEEKEAPTFSAQDIQAKIAYCQLCHLPSGQGFRAAFPIPRLAGQQTEYLENQLRAFTERRRLHPIMFTVAHSLNPAMQRAIAEHFKGLNPKPIGGAPKELVAAGKKLYEEGVPDADIPPCVACHGAEAKGNGAIPRLAGQLDDYIIIKLANWSNERGQEPANPDTTANMKANAQKFTQARIGAVAAYFQ